MANTDLLAFLTARGINLLTTPEWVTATYDEEILSTEPFEARFTFTTDDDTPTLTVDDDLSVVDIAKSTPSETTC